MNHGIPRRARVSRETRLLLVTALLSIGVLWILARIRFPDQPAPPNPVQPILTQLAARPRYDALADEIAQLRPRLEPLFAGSMLRIRDDVALTWLGPAPASAAEVREVLRADPASGLAVVKAPFLPAPPPVPWNPAELQQPRYLVAADAPTGAISLRPVFVGSLLPVESPLWPGIIWTVPPAVELTPGLFVFTTDGLLGGLVVEDGARIAIVPGAVLLAEANRLLAPSGGTPGTLGLEVQALTPPIARATGTGAGVIVTWVDPGGPAAAAVAIGDVLEAAAGAPLPTPLHWTARAASTRSSARRPRRSSFRTTIWRSWRPRCACCVLTRERRSSGTFRGRTPIACGSARGDGRSCRGRAQRVQLGVRHSRGPGESLVEAAPLPGRGHRT